MKIETKGDVFALPVSFSQERLWFLEQFERGTAVYNIPFISTVRGAIHLDEFNRAVNRLVERQESLRTFFIEQGGQPAQAIHEQLRVEVDRETLRGAGAQELQGICDRVTSTPFDLGKAPLFRIMLISSHRETTIITTTHHIISDGWSIGIFQRELSALYQEELGGRPAALPELPIQYADYAVWQRRNLQGERLERRMDYWRRQLAGATPVLEIPSDHPRPLKQTFNGDVHLFELPPALAAKIRALTRAQGATLFMTLFSAFAVLLYRLTGQKDLLVGTPIAGRKGSEVENLIGFFVNTLVLRARIEAGQSFVRLLSEVRKTTLEAFEHQELPFEKLVLELNPKRDLSHGPLIQVLFSLQNIPSLQEVLSGGLEAPAEAGQNLDGHTGTAKFDFALFVSEVGDLLQCSVEFNTDLFTLASVREISDYFLRLLEAVTERPEARVSTYPLLSQEQREHALEACLGRSRPVSRGRCCHHLFEDQARSAPDAIAVAHDSHGATLTYGELNARANRIARFLAARGVRPGDTVAVCMPRSVLQIAAILGIVKAGAAYVPLDPAHPRERLEYILGDVEARVVLSTTDTRSNLERGDQVVMLDEAGVEIAGQAGDDLGTEITPDAPLYVIHTSGSTGRPKGVVMPHRAIVNLVEWQARASGTETGTVPSQPVTPQFAALNFDVASQEIFSTLTSGGRLQLIDESVRREGPRLLEFLAVHRVSRLFLPPVALEELANAAGHGGGPLTELREVIVAGDTLRVTDSVRAWFEAMPGARLVNQYGPTETHVVSAYVLDGPVAGWPSQPPIGRAIDNVELYVLDEHLEPVPPKVIGELYIGGVAVALGYLKAPEQTAERFVANPLRGGEGILYRSGDLCRYDPEGVLTFLGRADQQIKLRGFRIEPGEVEVALKRHEGVEDAVVVKRLSRQGDDRLAAYLVMADGAGLDKARLRSRLGDQLPAYMIPAYFVPLDAFPLTSSGKIDRRRLPEPENEGTEEERRQSYVAPRTAVEGFLAQCWGDLLQVDEVGVHANFFDLGGHSLSATQLVSRIRDRFGVEVALYRIFERPTVELLALEVMRLQAAEEEENDLESLLGELEALSEEESEALLSQGGAGSP